MTDDDLLLPAASRRHLEWMALRNLSPNTIHARALLLRRLWECLGHPPVEATEAELATWQAGLEVGPDCMVAYVCHLRAFYRWAFLERLIDSNPAERLTMPRLGRRLPRPIGTAELMYAIVMAPDRIRPWLVLAAWGGLRCVEIALLRRENVLEAAAEPFVLVTAEATKGPNERAVPMCAFLAAELVPVLPRRGWVFGRGDGQPGPNTPSRVSHIGGDYLHGLGLDATMHSLRHWFGTRAYEASRDIRAVQELMGHRSARSTEGYTKISDPAKAAAVAALPVPGLSVVQPAVGGEHG